MYHTNYTRNIFKNKTQDVYLFTVDSREDSLARIRPVTPVIAVFCSVAGRLSVIHTRLKKASMSSLEEHQSTEDMAFSWCSQLESSRPLLVDFFEQKMLEEYLRVTREVSAT